MIFNKSFYLTITGYAYIKPLNPSNSTPLTLPGTVNGAGATLQKIKDIDQKQGVYQMV
jgi:hypothetical protein